MESRGRGRAIEEKKKFGGKALESDKKRSYSIGMAEELAKRKMENYGGERRNRKARRCLKKVIKRRDLQRV